MFGLVFEGWLEFGEGVVFATGYGGVVRALLWFLLRCACSAEILMDDDRRVVLFLGVGECGFGTRGTKGFCCCCSCCCKAWLASCCAVRFACNC